MTNNTNGLYEWYMRSVAEAVNARDLRSTLSVLEDCLDLPEVQVQRVRNAAAKRHALWRAQADMLCAGTEKELRCLLEAAGDEATTDTQRAELQATFEECATLLRSTQGTRNNDAMHQGDKQ